MLIAVAECGPNFDRQSTVAGFDHDLVKPIDHLDLTRIPAAAKKR